MTQTAGVARTGTYVVDAFNTATASANKIHDDAVARAYGFRGGLVPGVDVYAYMTHAPVERWGAAWLRGGSISVRFDHPVYDGQRVAVTAAPSDGVRGEQLRIVIVGPDGTACATATATAAAPDDQRPLPAAAPLPEVRPPTSAASLAAGTTLGSLRDTLELAHHRAYLADVRENLPLYLDEPCAHPGWLLRCANTILSRNVALGPWIHVASEVTLRELVRPGQAIEVRAAVLDETERKGHRFVELDVAVLADGELAQRVHHTAIHTPRRR